MRSIREIYTEKVAAGKAVISFEFFPPKSEEGDLALLEKQVPALLAARPDFCSVTYGAGGTTREKTLHIVDQIQRRHGLPALAHLTCVSHTEAEVERLLENIRTLDCRNILALRGDPPGGGAFQPTPGGFQYSAELVRFIRRHGDFSIGVAGFPEGHVACGGDKHGDWQHLKEKVDAGADFVMTQLFFDNADYFAFRDHVAGRLGVTVPLVPGIIPIVSAAQIKRITQLCGAKIPAAMRSRLDALGADDEAVTKLGIELAIQQCDELLRAGAPGLHFYTLNKAHSTVEVLRHLKLS